MNNVGTYLNLPKKAMKYVKIRMVNSTIDT